MIGALKMSNKEEELQLKPKGKWPGGMNGPVTEFAGDQENRGGNCSSLEQL
jgi:hypothetical protein